MSIDLLTLNQRLSKTRWRAQGNGPNERGVDHSILSATLISSITHDSRRVEPGSLYVALSGRVTHGARFIAQAIARGATAIAAPTDTPPDLLLAIEETSVKPPILWLSPLAQRREMALLSEWIYESPISGEEDRLQLIGVTGTNGKTTTSTLLADILCLADGDAGLIGTIETRGGGVIRASEMTTMESSDLHRHYRDLLRAGVKRCVMEVSSIGIEEERVAASRYSRAAFLNLSEDHLDYHGDMERYAEAKLRLFNELLTPDALCVICVEGQSTSAKLISKINEACARRGITIWRYSQESEALSTGIEVGWQELELSTQGIKGIVRTPHGEVEIDSPLMGDFNAANIAVAVAIAHSLSIPSMKIKEAIKRSMISGRMEPINLNLETSINHKAPAVRVDYAHTPDALERALRALKPHCQGHLWVIFGCGGSRDRLKRPLMGAATSLADGIVLTSDNPRDEDPLEIMEEVVPALIASGKSRAEGSPQVGAYWVEPDRGLAIHTLIRSAGEDDLILIAGKGHESYQEIRGKRVAFSDQEYAREALNCRLLRIEAHHHLVEEQSTLTLCSDIGGLLLFGEHQSLCGADIDSRKLSRDRSSAFFCLAGQRDGHEFIPQAISSGAKVIVVKRGWSPDEALVATLRKDHITVIETADPQRALSLWAVAHRHRVFKGKLIALTGSNGKTSTKELLASALSEIGPTLSTYGNYNNHLGVPLTLLRLRSTHRFAVIEMGMNAPGEIAQLTAWAAPDLGLITTIAPAHLEGLGSVEAVAQAKGELITEMNGNPVIVPAQLSKHLRSWAAQESLQRAEPQLYLLPSPFVDEKTPIMDLLPHEKMFWPSLSVYDSELSLKGSQSALEIDDQDYRLDLQMLGRHQIENARLALAAGIVINELELTPLPQDLDRPRSIDPSLIEQLLRGLSAQAPASMRGELYAYHRPIQLSDKRQVSQEETQSQSEESRGTLWVDCYNANPQSMLASIKTFFESGEEGALILGSIGELGGSSSRLHRELGQSISTLIGEKTTLFTVGDQAHFMYLGLQEAGIEPHRLYHYSQGELENLLIEVASLNPPSILIKGSRSVQLERLLDPLGSIPLSSLSHPKE